MNMNYARKILITTVIFGILFFAGIMNSTKVYAMKYTTVYLQVGEKYKQNTTSNSPVFDCLTSLKGVGYNSSGTQVCTPTWNSSTVSKRTSFTITAKNAGSCTFYVNKGNSTHNDNRVRTVKVYVYNRAENMTANLKNNISHASGTTNYTNQQVYVYSGNSFSITTVPSGTLPTNVSGDTSGKAKAVSASSIYECANASGSNITNNTWYMNAYTLSGTNRSFTARELKKGSNYQATYIRGAIRWTSSTGASHWTPYRVIKINIYRKPVLNMYSKQGQALSSLNLIMGNPYNIIPEISYMQPGDIIGVHSAVIQDAAKVDVTEEDGMWKIIPIGKTFYTPVRITFKYTLNNILSSCNGSAYTTFTKVLSVNVADLEAVKFTDSKIGKKSITLYWEKNNSASRYIVYRAESANGNYEEIDRTSECYYTDSDEEFVYNKTYFYKVKMVCQDETTTSPFSDAYGVKLILLKPEIANIKKTGNYYLFTFSGIKYTGYELYDGNNLIVSTKSTTVSVPLEAGTHNLKVRSYYKNSSGTKVYSAYSTIKNFKIVEGQIIKNKKEVMNPKKPKVKRVKTRKKSVMIVFKKKCKYYQADRFEIKISRSKSFKKAKIVRTLKQRKIIKKLKRNRTYYIKVRTFKNVNNVRKYSKYTKTKIVKTKR